jgi:hypothetical protein
MPTSEDINLLKSMLQQKSIGLGEIAANETAPSDFGYKDILTQFKGNMDQQRAVNEVTLQDAQARLKNTQDSYTADAANRDKACQLSQESLAGMAVLEKELMTKAFDQQQKNRANDNAFNTLYSSITRLPSTSSQGYVVGGKKLKVKV